jgi:WD40-like Beta Propeller Repeat
MSLQAQFPTITWITSGSNLIDYRPAIAANGQTIFFERMLLDVRDPRTTLYVLHCAGEEPEPFLPEIDAQLTRPDCCWSTGKVAFNVLITGEKMLTVWTVCADGQGACVIKNTEGFIYPQWSADGQSMAVMNNNRKSATPSPCTSVIDTAGNITCANINGNDANGNPVFAGMPAVNPNNPMTVAFAGQPQLSGWITGTTDVTYNQDNNYIFCNSQSDSDFCCAPVESGAPIDGFDPAFQGRAPAWSPDGRYIVFESTRTDNKMALYLFDTQLMDDERRNPIQLTDPCYGAEHAKFFPCGRKLIFCARPDSQTQFRIASIDISQYIDA